MKFTQMAVSRFARALDNPFVSPDEMDIILSLAASEDVEHVLEIGTNRGVTTGNIARILKKKGRGRVVSIDVAYPPDGLPESQATEVLPLSELGAAIPPEVRDVVDLGIHRPDYPGDLTSVLDTYTKDRRFDLVFMDGDHSYEGVKMASESIRPYLNDAAMILFHDVWFDEDPPPVGGPMRYLEEIGGEVVNFTHIGLAMAK